MSALRILVADDHEIVRRGLCAILRGHAGWEVCGEAGDGEEAAQKAHELRPDIVILDIGMPRVNGLETTRQILQDRPTQKVLILTVSDSEQVVHEVLKAGARGYVLKSDAGRELAAAVEALQCDRTYFTSRVGELVLDSFLNKGRLASREMSIPGLTAREREIVKLLAEGKTSKEVAATLGMSVKTAETHRGNLMRKLKLHSVSELVLYAVRNGIVPTKPTGDGTGISAA
ncbi:MAG TPA: response regulator transcription factor [Terriglobales bacterium]|nr:response regulator transcription factor [Terriglobales bacterium]